MADAAWALDAAELATAYAAGDLTPVQALDACLARTEAVNPALNAMVALNRTAASAAAAESAARWRKGVPLGPLDGVPVTVKDNLFVAGMRATWGSRLFAEHEAPRDDIPVARLRAAGAVILGKTNTPEFALSGFTDNLLFGSTGNPWAPSLQPGGSSGGAVAAVASGIGPIALATDAGGSLRRPAGHAGVATLKPTTGLVPRRWGFPPLAADFQVIGPIARSVRDLRTTLNVIAGPRAAAPAAGRLRIRAVLSCADAPTDPGVRAAFADALQALAQLGHAIEDVAAPWHPEEVTKLFATLASAGVARVVDSHPGWEHLVTPGIRAQAEAGFRLSAPAYVAALDRVAALRAELTDWISEADVLVTPSSAVLPWPRDRAFPDMVDGRPAGPRTAAIYSTVVNLAGLPAVVVPSRPAGGLPTGLQIVGPPFSEALLLDLAARYEALRPWQRLAPL